MAKAIVVVRRPPLQVRAQQRHHRHIIKVQRVEYPLTLIKVDSFVLLVISLWSGHVKEVGYSARFLSSVVFSWFSLRIGSNFYHITSLSLFFIK